MAELGIITMLAKQPKKAMFTADQLIEIYEKSGRKTDTAALKAVAAELYPDITLDGRPPVWVSEGHGRGFVIDGKMVKPKYTVSTYRALNIGILPDGTPVKF